MSLTPKMKFEMGTWVAIAFRLKLTLQRISTRNRATLCGGTYRV